VSQLAQLKNGRVQPVSE